MLNPTNWGLGMHLGESLFSFFNRSVVLVIAGALLPVSVSATELLITAPPFHGKLESEKFIQPLAQIIEKETGISARYVHQEDWLEYTRNVRLDIYDLLISEAHIAAWAMQSGTGGGGLEHKAIIKREAEHKLYLVSKLPDLVTQKNLLNTNICVKPSPSVDAIQLYNLYQDPVRQPQVQEVNSGYEAILEMLNKGQCGAAVLPEDVLWNQVHVKTVHEFDSIPGPVLTMSSRLPHDLQNTIVNALIRRSEYRSLVEKAWGIASHTEISQYEPAWNELYKDYDLLLQRVWGW